MAGEKDVAGAELAESAFVELPKTMDAERGGEAGGLGEPIRLDTRGHRDEGGAVAGAAEQQGEGLDRLAESHIIGEAAAEVGIGSPREPAISRELVRAEVAAELGRQIEAA